MMNPTGASLLPAAYSDGVFEALAKDPFAAWLSLEGAASSSSAAASGAYHPRPRGQHAALCGGDGSLRPTSLVVAPVSMGHLPSPFLEALVRHAVRTGSTEAGRQWMQSGPSDVPVAQSAGSDDEAADEGDGADGWMADEDDIARDEEEDRDEERDQDGADDGDDEAEESFHSTRSRVDGGSSDDFAGSESGNNVNGGDEANSPPRDRSSAPTPPMSPLLAAPGAGDVVAAVKALLRTPFELLAVEPYSRSSAGVTVDVTTCRTPVALEKTMHFLVHHYMRTPHSALVYWLPFDVWSYLWDRLRTVRTNWVLQLPGVETIYAIEDAATKLEAYGGAAGGPRPAELRGRVQHMRRDVVESKRRLKWLEFTVAALAVQSVNLCRTEAGCRQFMPHKQHFLESIAQCLSDLVLAYRAAATASRCERDEKVAQHSEFFSVLAIYYGLNQTAKIENRAGFCRALSVAAPGAPTHESIFEMPCDSTNLASVYKELFFIPEMTRTTHVRAALRLIHCAAQREWFLFFYICRHERLTVVQRAMLFQSFSYMRFRAVADLVTANTLVYHRCRARGHISVATLTHLLLFASEADCVLFLEHMGLSRLLVHHAAAAEGGDPVYELQLCDEKSAPLITPGEILSYMEERATKAQLLLPVVPEFLGFSVCEDDWRRLGVGVLDALQHSTALPQLDSLRTRIQSITAAELQALGATTTSAAQFPLSCNVRNASCPVNIMTLLEPYCPHYNDDVQRLQLHDASESYFAHIEEHRANMLRHSAHQELVYERWRQGSAVDSGAPPYVGPEEQGLVDALVFGAPAVSTAAVGTPWNRLPDSAALDAEGEARVQRFLRTDSPPRHCSVDAGETSCSVENAEADVAPPPAAAPAPPPAFAAVMESQNRLDEQRAATTTLLSNAATVLATLRCAASYARRPCPGATVEPDAVLPMPPPSPPPQSASPPSAVSTGTHATQPVSTTASSLLSQQQPPAPAPAPLTLHPTLVEARAPGSDGKEGSLPRSTTVAPQAELQPSTAAAVASAHPTVPPPSLSVAKPTSPPAPCTTVVAAAVAPKRVAADTAAESAVQQDTFTKVSPTAPFIAVNSSTCSRSPSSGSGSESNLEVRLHVEEDSPRVVSTPSLGYGVDSAPQTESSPHPTIASSPRRTALPSMSYRQAAKAALKRKRDESFCREMPRVRRAMRPVDAWLAPRSNEGVPLVLPRHGCWASFVGREYVASLGAGSQAHTLITEQLRHLARWPPMEKTDVADEASHRVYRKFLARLATVCSGVVPSLAPPSAANDGRGGDRIMRLHASFVLLGHFTPQRRGTCETRSSDVPAPQALTWRLTALLGADDKRALHSLSGSVIAHYADACAYRVGGDLSPAVFEPHSARSSGALGSRSVSRIRAAAYVATPWAACAVRPRPSIVTTATTTSTNTGGEVPVSSNVTHVAWKPAADGSVYTARPAPLPRTVSVTCVGIDVASIAEGSKCSVRDVLWGCGTATDNTTVIVALSCCHGDEDDDAGFEQTMAALDRLVQNQVDGCSDPRLPSVCGVLVVLLTDSRADDDRVTQSINDRLARSTRPRHNMGCPGAAVPLPTSARGRGTADAAPAAATKSPWMELDERNRRLGSSSVAEPHHWDWQSVPSLVPHTETRPTRHSWFELPVAPRASQLAKQRAEQAETLQAPAVVVLPLQTAMWDFAVHLHGCNASVAPLSPAESDKAVHFAFMNCLETLTEAYRNRSKQMAMSQVSPL